MSIYRLRLYEADDETLLAEFSTDPAHPFPHLQVPDSLVEQQIDLARGAATIGQIGAGIIDYPTIPGDQASGRFTAILATLGGYSALMGHRAVWEEDSGAGFATLMDGIVTDVDLAESFSGYALAFRDIRERERKTRVFITTAVRDADGTLLDAPCVWPRGRVQPFAALPGGGHLVPASVPASGTYHTVTAGSWVEGWITLPPMDHGAGGVWLRERAFTEHMRGACAAADDTGRLTHVRLRYRTAAGPWTEAPDLYQPYRLPGSDDDATDGFVRTASDFITGFNWRWGPGVASPLPNNTAVQFQIVYVGPPSESYPLRWEGEAGQLLAELYAGRFSPAPPRIAADPVALAAMRTPLMLAVTKPVDDLRGWAERNVYAPLGAAPAVDPQGRISPVVYGLPPLGAVVVELNNGNCRAHPGWRQSTGDAVNTVKVEYWRDWPVAAALDPFQEHTTGDGVRSRQVTISRDDPDSVELLGEHLLELKPETLRAIGTARGEPLGGDRSNEVGARLAAARAQQALDRFSLGGQRMTVEAMRSDPAVEALRVGDWVIDATSWKPEYATGRRGANRLAQVASRRNEDPSWTTLALIDAGPANQPVGQPSLSIAGENADGMVTVNVTAVPAAAEAAVYYAVSPTLPSTLSPLWTYAGRVGAPGVVRTPPLPAGVTVWVRGRGEAQGRRPSGYTNATSLVTATTPRLFNLLVEVDEDGAARATWDRNPFTANVRFQYSILPAGASATYDQVQDAPGAAGEMTFADTVPPGFEIAVRAQPFAGAAGASVGGTYAYARVVGADAPLEVQQPPVWEVVGTRERVVDGDYVGTARWRGRTRGVPVTSMLITTRVGREARSAPAAPPRTTGTASVVNPGETLGELDFEADVLLVDRLSEITALALLESGEPQTIPLPPFDRNALPTIISIGIDGQKATCAGDGDTKSWSASYGTWEEHRDGSGVSFLSIPVPDAESWNVEFTARSVPVANAGAPGALAVTESRIVRGATVAASPERPTWAAEPYVAAPAAGSAVASITLRARPQLDTSPPLATYGVRVWERHRTGGGAWTTFADIGVDMDPSPDSPRSEGQTHAYNAGRIRSDAGTVLFTIEVKAEIVDSDGAIVDARSGFGSWNVASRIIPEPE